MNVLVWLAVGAIAGIGIRKVAGWRSVRPLDCATTGGLGGIFAAAVFTIGSGRSIAGFEALRAGASGYVLKSAADRDLVGACRASMRGEPFIYPAAVKTLIRDYLERAKRGEDAPDDPLTQREGEVVKLIAEAHSNREIAAQLVISEKTVERHRANILEKLGMHDRVELTRYAIRRGLVEP